MVLRIAIPLSLLFFAYGNVPDVPHFVPPNSSGPVRDNVFTPDDRVPLYPSIVSSGPQDASKGAQTTPNGKKHIASGDVTKMPTPTRQLL